MWTRSYVLGTVALTAVLIAGPAAANRGQTQDQHQHDAVPQTPDQAAPQPSDQVGHDAMMQRHQQMRAEMQAADAELQSLVQQMQQATGGAKIAVMETLLTRLVAQRAQMHARMAEMHESMMSQMMQQHMGNMRRQP